MSESVKSVVRSLKLLELLYAEHGALRLAEIAQTLDLPKSSCLMLLRTLVSLGYVERDAEGSYSLSSTSFGPASWIEDDRAILRSESQPVLQRLTGLISQTSALCVLTKRPDSLVIEAVQSRAPVRYEILTGTRFPLFCSATGRCFLAFSPKEMAERYLAQCNFRKFTENTITDPEHIREVLIQTREQGYAINLEEHAPGTISVASPVYDRRGGIIAAVNVGCVASSFAPMRDRIIEAVCQAANRITEAVE